ncbi:threonylcarbamoyladenosine tRNA methylthiotransferase MtaB [Balneicella halophila]|uniref:Threonylcarbamoyladenosine tRNA methylthiotransferase MtaB n=1 Tax=Balneicella halophila TaxID=1537566 RepID=A0A7L4UPW8_BALHA|nr:tRNA (N(6)-L-threonylcarbamoyladenosine(37)-C(2))-methylthiotransferase MtaB [Balneicella halophila]PVX51084.1 threonylcarbamoyladenosine tRNA methylthiotransferase MtaB [Balneicella halophila]
MNIKKKRIAFKTLGCRLNHYETDSIATQFDNGDYEIVPFDNEADIYLINSCTVTHESDKKVKTFIKRAHRTNERAMTVVMGCMANSEQEALEAREDVSLVIGNEKKSYVHSLIDAQVKGEILELDNLQENRFNYGIAAPIFHTRSLIKIQDGCDNFCSFCIIPQVRGRGVSRPVNEILENIQNLIGAGYKEVVITGVNIGRYKSEGLNFEGLLSKILNLEGDFRVRISSLEPDGFTEDFYKLFSHPKLTPHLHLCLQSGSDKVLKDMRRMYDVEQFRKVVQSMRKHIPNFNFTTDIIVGFPGETDDDLQYTLDLMEEFHFGHVHTFKYSKRKRTKAANMENQVPEIIKTQRSEKVRTLAEKLQQDYRKQFLGTQQKVLIERVHDDYATGYGEHFVPVKIVGKNLIHNTFYHVGITAIEENKDFQLVGNVL